MSWRGGIKRDKYDALFSDLIRERADWTCERCDANWRHNPALLHASHLYGRRKQSTRFDPDNVFAHCYRCHAFLGEHPIEFAEWARGKLGAQRYDRLRIVAAKPAKYTKAEKEIRHAHYLEQRKIMKLKRAEGHTGRLEFQSF